MNQKKFPWVEAVGVAGLMAIFSVVIMVLWPMTHCDQAASWAQAFGSFGAICGAVCIYYAQGQATKTQAGIDARTEVRHMLLGIRDELDVTSKAFQENAGRHIENSAKGEAIRVFFPIADHPFPLYEANLFRLGKIPSDELRKSIIVGHGKLRGFVLSVRFNNVLVERFNKAESEKRIQQSSANHLQCEIELAMLTNYGDGIRKLASESAAAVNEIIPAIDRFLESDGVG